MERRNELYLLVLSILLGISVLKFNELFALSKEVHRLLFESGQTTLTPTAVGVFIVVSGYLLFFILLALAAYGIVQQIRGDGGVSGTVDMGQIVGMCVLYLGVAYMVAFCVALFDAVGQPGTGGT